MSAVDGSSGHSATKLALESWRARIHAELYASVMPFWMRHSLDREHGGFFNCLDRDGAVYDTKKHVWLQGRQVWMLSKLARHAVGASAESKSAWLAAARRGAIFLRDHCRRPDRRVYFCVTRAGLPVQLQRKMFSECFYVMAMAEFARASGEDWARREALDVFEWVLAASKDSALTGRPRLAGEVAARSLAVPMILLNLIGELDGDYGGPMASEARRCAREALDHARAGTPFVLETIAADGTELDSPEGRLLNPGHAIEAGWFLLDFAEQTRDDATARRALSMIADSLDVGWDPEHGGLLYFLDARGYSPVQLEWSMKLWWPHCEALVATLQAFVYTRDPRWFARFEKVAAWTFAHFPDAQHGEWFGYLDREGRVSQRFKGGPYKGCFHVPRALFLCERLIDRASSAP